MIFKLFTKYGLSAQYIDIQLMMKAQLVSANGDEKICAVISAIILFHY